MADKQVLDRNGHTPWDVSTADYDEKSKDVSAQDWSPYGVRFKPDGTKMYIIGLANHTVYQYSLSTPWDVSTADYDEESKDVNAQEPYPYDVCFKPDGTKMYIMGFYNSTVYQYSLSTPWAISTADYDKKSKDVSAQDTYSHGICFKPDGTKMYMVGDANNTIYQYSLSTPWDVSTADYDEMSKYVGDQDTYPYDVCFKPDGTKMYLVGDANNTVYQYSLSTPWDVSTADYDEESKDVSAQDTGPLGVCFKPDGTKMYIMGWANSTVYQYSLPPPVVGRSFGFIIG
ncbi:hypothetical protein ES708_16561 [subsurface metagenome]